jgi:hypothetical protein
LDEGVHTAESDGRQRESKLREHVEGAGIQEQTDQEQAIKFSTVTVPENKLTELQIKASQRDELLEALINALPNLHIGDELPMSYYADKKGVLGGALRAIAKAKGENE